MTRSYLLCFRAVLSEDGRIPFLELFLEVDVPSKEEMGAPGRQSHLTSHGDSRLDAQQTAAPPTHYKQHMFRSDLPGGF